MLRITYSKFLIIIPLDKEEVESEMRTVDGFSSGHWSLEEVSSSESLFWVRGISILEDFLSFLGAVEALALPLVAFFLAGSRGSDRGLSDGAVLGLSGVAQSVTSAIW